MRRRIEAQWSLSTTETYRRSMLLPICRIICVKRWTTWRKKIQLDVSIPCGLERARKCGKSVLSCRTRLTNASFVPADCFKQAQWTDCIEEKIRLIAPPTRYSFIRPVALLIIRFINEFIGSETGKVEICNHVNRVRREYPNCPKYDENIPDEFYSV